MIMDSIEALINLFVQEIVEQAYVLQPDRTPMIRNMQSSQRGVIEDV